MVFNGRGISAGDYNQDSFVDVVIGGKGKISLFENVRGKSFLRQDLYLGVDPETRFVNVAFVDLNGDSTLDIYASTFEEGDFVLYGNNDLTGFSRPPEKVPTTPGVTNAVAFADFDKDGDMDILQGGTPIIVVPFGFVANDGGPPLPEAFEAQPRPFGVGFNGAACSEPRLIEIAYAFEQATKRRVAPPLFR